MGAHHRAWSHQRGLALRDFGVRPHRGKAVDLEQGRTSHHGHSFAHRQLDDHAANGRGDGRARLRLAGTLHQANLLFVHAGLPHALARAIDQGCHVIALHPLEREELLLRSHPIRHIQINQWLALADPIQRCAYVQALHVARSTRLHNNLVAFVEGNAAHRRNLRRELALCDHRRAHPQVLLDARADGYLSLVGVAICIYGYQHHVHERRLGRLVELVAWHHGVVVVKDLAAVGRVHIPSLDAFGHMPPRCLLALSDALRHGAWGLEHRRNAGHGSHAAAPAHAYLVDCVAAGGDHCDQSGGR